MAKLSCFLLLSMAVFLVNGHTYFSSITIDGVVHPENDCMRPHPSNEYDYPISQLGRTNGLSTNDMTCGWLPAASRPANKKCPVNPGSKVTLQWHYEMGLGSSDNFIIDPSHKGPCLVYMAKSESGSGPVWFKIFEDGYNRTSKKWCVDKLRANGGKFEVTIPTDIAPGNYLFRGELIALHEGDQLYGAQPYVGCAELTVGGSGTVDPPAKVAIPGAYSPTDPGIHFDIYTGSNPAYPIPGPALYISAAQGNPSTPVPPNVPVPVTSRAATTRAATTSKVTSGRASNVGSSTTSKQTTGRVASAPATTGSAPPNPPTPTPVPSPVPTPTAPCTLGYQRCAGGNAYQTCGWATQTITAWSAVQSCPAGLSCHAVQENYVWCY